MKFQSPLTEHQCVFIFVDIKMVLIFSASSHLYMLLLVDHQWNKCGKTWSWKHLLSLGNITGSDSPTAGDWPADTVRMQVLSCVSVPLWCNWCRIVVFDNSFLPLGWRMTSAVFTSNHEEIRVAIFVPVILGASLLPGEWLSHLQIAEYQLFTRCMPYCRSLCSPCAPTATRKFTWHGLSCSET